MSAGVDPDAACAVLGVDAWGLQRLIALGDIEADGAPGDRRIAPEALAACADRRRRRRAEALAELARLDGPHLRGEP